MKKLLFAVLFIPITASAEVVATLQNQAGGKIVLTDEQCKYGNKVYEPLKRSYNYGSDGNTGEGCWYVEDETVVIVWKLKSGEATTRRYPAENFSIRKRSGSNL